jgi:hypothetical protein
MLIWSPAILLSKKAAEQSEAKAAEVCETGAQALERECRVPGRTFLSMSLLARLSFGPGKKGGEAELRGE